jgi:hypothetical protein
MARKVGYRSGNPPPPPPVPMPPVLRPASTLLLIAALTGCEQLAPPQAASLSLASPIATNAPAGSAVTGLAVQVKDQYGVAMAGQPLVVSTSTGTVANAPTQTVAGTTSLGTWTLAPKTGVNVLTVTSGPRSITISIVGVAGPAAKITGTVPATGIVGRQTQVTFTVTDAFDNALAATIISASADAGSIPTSAAVTDGTGTATLTWVLGTTKGTQTITATSGGASKAFPLVAAADVPAQITVATGDNQSVLAGTTLPIRPTVVVADRFGNVTPGRTVLFSLTLGGGSLAGPVSVVTDNNGVAQAPIWTVGKQITTQRVVASTSGVSAPINASIPAGLPIALRYFGAGIAPYQAFFQNAALRLRAMIVSGAAAENVSDLAIAAPACGVVGEPNISEVISGIVIYAGVYSVDGPGGVVTRTAICASRGTASLSQPLVASIIVDADDIATLPTTFEQVVTHEMLHALGFGTLWATNAIINVAAPADPRYTGVSSGEACTAISALANCAGNTIPAEETGGAGIYALHWRESVFGNEMMTGYLTGILNPLSRMTVIAMRDLGYVTNPAAADDFNAFLRLERTPMRSTLSENWERVVNASAILKALPRR